MKDRLLAAFIMEYQNPAEIIDELNLSHEDVLDMLLSSGYRSEVYALLNNNLLLSDEEENINEGNIEYDEGGFYE